MQSREIILKKKGPSVYVPYGKAFSGARSTDEGAGGFLVSHTPATRTLDEINLAIPEVQKRGNELAYTGLLLVGDDPLLKKTHEELTAYEQSNNLPLTATINGVRRNNLAERVVLIREAELA